MRKEDLRLAAGLTTNMIANMGKGEHISMKTLLRICGTLDCDISDVIALERDKISANGKGAKNEVRILPTYYANKWFWRVSSLHFNKKQFR